MSIHCSSSNRAAEWNPLDLLSHVTFNLQPAGYRMVRLEREEKRKKKKKNRRKQEEKVYFSRDRWGPTIIHSAHSTLYMQICLAIVQVGAEVKGMPCHANCEAEADCADRRAYNLQQPQGADCCFSLLFSSLLTPKTLTGRCWPRAFFFLLLLYSLSWKGNCNALYTAHRC